MAKIIPFRGIVYNPKKVGNLSTVATPPYDVITPQEQIAFYASNPYNIIRLTLGLTFETDVPGNNRHTRSAIFLKEWLKEEILIQDPLPAFYLTSMDFPANGRSIRRWGLIALVALETFEKGVVLPHEKTFSRVKAERLELMKSCHINESQIFSLYSDPEHVVVEILKNACNSAQPDMKFTDSFGHFHQLWRVTDQVVHERIADFMEEKALFIADGHHRYETALNYMNWMADRTPGFSKEHPANFTMMYLCSMEDPGLIVLPAHRMLKSVSNEGFLNEAGKYFDITSIPFEPGKPAEEVAEKWSQIMNAETPRTRIGIMISNDPKAYLLVLKPGVMKQKFSHEMSEAMLELDVTVLTRLILTEILGLDHQQLDNEAVISYSSNIITVTESLRAEESQIAFILNATRIDQVKRIAESGEIMPRKSTYFYPKVITGQVLNSLTSSVFQGR